MKKKIAEKLMDIVLKFFSTAQLNAVVMLRQTRNKSSHIQIAIFNYFLQEWLRVSLFPRKGEDTYTLR